MRSSAGSAWVSNMHYVDTHAHIFDEAFKDDFEGVVDRAVQAHVDRMLIICLNHEDTMRSIDFCQRDSYRYKTACAVFPEDVGELTDEKWNQFLKDAELKEVSVLGEMGLDYHWEKDPGIRKSPPFLRPSDQGLPIPMWSISDPDVYGATMPIVVIPELAMLESAKSMSLYLPPYGTDASVLSSVSSPNPLP